MVEIFWNIFSICGIIAAIGMTIYIIAIIIWLIKDMFGE